ncbi:MAG: response regulator [Selenomonas sp.]|uniref:ANTAR domain-containing response regulator n=1 Tax=Selenomonas sp. AE3005 TaxID=1485543 RepID=UPI0025CCF75F|nr:response regulator [Selenomonas sp. AE3005]MBQ1462462.1 response regulator [Selenomonas sp.]MBQ1919519.1 response regulator [Selenomonas sp.]MBQ2137159.1 response regulator [Selenomonas sp.]MBQ5419789.1 response regulator [Selenomonas sp.]MBQ5502906.1 response regulator [Selenomonas sp.]
MQGNKKSLRIVIADNESLIRLDIREMLEDAGHEVVGEAVNGRRAVELTRQHRPDLVLMDIKMPEMDGITAAGKIYADKIAPVILLTAFSQPDIVDKAKDSGVLGYLVKPVQESQLFPAIEIALSRWQEMQGLEDELEKLKDSLETRKLIDRAKGIIMAAHKLGEQEAYRRMQQYAMQKRVPLKDVAQSIIRAAGGKA